MPHHHTILELWILFVVGQAIHILKQSDLSLGSKSTFFLVAWKDLVVRFFIAAVFFGYWLAHPEALTQLLGLAHINFSLTLAPEHATAAGFGFCSDSGLDWITAKFPKLRSDIPSRATGEKADEK